MITFIGHFLSIVTSLIVADHHQFRVTFSVARLMILMLYFLEE